MKGPGYRLSANRRPCECNNTMQSVVSQKISWRIYNGKYIIQKGAVSQKEMHGRICDGK